MTTSFRPLARFPWVPIVFAASACSGGAPLQPASAAGRPSAVHTAPQELARIAVRGDRAQSDAAIAALRAMGPPGLEVLLTTWHDELPRISDVARGACDPTGEVARLSDAIDKVARQRDVHASRLYWYTDFAEARRAAEASGRPILSLRLLGQLDEELSCANSRLFRTALYANSQVSEYLRDHFVLYWKSERPVPRITIDFGDGRQMVRTVTGNSIHYVLDAHGRVVDALPGLYGPGEFLRAIRDDYAEAHVLSALSGAARNIEMMRFHTQAINAQRARWAEDVGVIHAQSGPPAPSVPPRPTDSAAAAPPAATAMRVTYGKALIEAPMMAHIDPRRDIANPDHADDALWSALGAMHQRDAVLDEASTQLFHDKLARIPDGAARAMVPISSTDLASRRETLERAIAVDTVRNEFTRHAMLHAWLANEGDIRLEALNDRVYTYLFLTPRGDPWLGLQGPNAYTGIANDGFVLDRGRSP